MSPQIELITGVQSRRIDITAERWSIGTAPENDVCLEDPTASRMHAMLEHFPAGWCVTDLGSTNGTWINGERLYAMRRLQHGDELRMGQTRLIFRDPLAAGVIETEIEAGPPSLTPRERDVLIALCRPMMSRDMFTEPASTRAIAEELVVTEAAVKQHMANLYDKFGLSGGASNRRARLANEALRRGAVLLAELQE